MYPSPKTAAIAVPSAYLSCVKQRNKHDPRCESPLFTPSLPSINSEHFQSQRTCYTFFQVVCCFSSCYFLFLAVRLIIAILPEL